MGDSKQPWTKIVTLRRQTPTVLLIPELNGILAFEATKMFFGLGKSAQIENKLEKSESNTENEH